MKTLSLESKKIFQSSVEHDAVTHEEALETERKGIKAALKERGEGC